MTVSDRLGGDAANPGGPAARAPAGSEIEPAGARILPQRPPLVSKAAPPVLVKLPPPAVVRISQILWVLSLFTGAVAVIYLFVIRQAQLPDIATLVKGVDETRVDATYTTAADIIFWSVFGVLIAVMLIQITLQVSFAGRRPNVRWWQLGTILVLAGLFLLARELVAIGERGVPLVRILLLQLGLCTLGLLFSVLPPALKWTARQHDVRRGPEGSPGGDL